MLGSYRYIFISSDIIKKTGYLSFLSVIEMTVFSLCEFSIVSFLYTVILLLYTKVIKRRKGYF